MRAIYKYELQPIAEQIILMPQIRDFLHIGTQANEGKESICVWALIDDQAESQGYPVVEQVRFQIIGTGNPADSSFSKGSYIGTVMTREESLVSHIFSEPWEQS